MFALIALLTFISKTFHHSLKVKVGDDGDTPPEDPNKNLTPYQIE